VALVALLLYGGYQYLLTTPWGPSLTLFADGHRAEHFQAMDRVFPSVPVRAGADIRVLIPDERPIPARYAYAGLERAREPGVYNEYASSDSGVLALVLARATGMSLARYLETHLWQPAGLESDAFWSTDRSGAAAIGDHQDEHSHVHDLWNTAGSDPAEIPVARPR